MDHRLYTDINQLYQPARFNSIVCICNNDNTLLNAILSINLPIKTLHIISTDINTNQLQLLYPNKYKVVTSFNDISDCTYIYVDTDIKKENKIIIDKFIKINDKYKFIIHKSTLINNTNYLQFFISPDYIIMTKKPDLIPCIFSYLNIETYTYSFNSSCISISQDNLIFTNIHAPTNKLIYSVRTSHSKTNHSDLVFCDNTGKLFPKMYRYSDNLPIVREDMRFFVWKNKLYGSYTFINPYISGIKTNNSLTVGMFSYINNNINLEYEIIPQYGGNLNNEIEKNWSWWESPEGNLHCVYWFNPFTVISFSSLEAHPIEITNFEDKQLIKGHIRGGACGVVWDNKVWFFTHTFTEESSYNIGIVVLSYDENPRILGWNHMLIKSSDFSNVIFYVCGAVFNREIDMWHLTGGIQDTKCFTLDLPYTYVYSKVNWIK